MGRLTILDEGGDAKKSCATAPAIHVNQGNEGGVGAAIFAGRAALITLGCAKNHVDSEVMLGVLRARGFEVVSKVEDADVAIVNTCGFLQSAVEESIDCIIDVAELKKTGRLRKLVVAGCAVERYKDPSGKYQSMQEALPEVDAFLSVNDVLRVADVSTLVEPGQAKDSLLANTTPAPDFGDVLDAAARPYFLYDDSMPRELATKRHFAYVKVSEGCNRPCTFCIIPKIRGTMRSRQIDSVLRETESLANQGVREINLVAQDLTSFGLDQAPDKYGNGRRLRQLLEALDRQAAVDWVRLLYAYPVGTDVALIEAIRDLPRVVEYLDIPLQHASTRVLKEMKRPIGSFAPRPMVEWIRKTAPSIAIRTTFIVGFPGETEEDVQELESFVREGHFSSVGVFTYSLESGTPSFDMDCQVSEKEKASRRERIMQAQQEVVAKRLSGYIGQSIQVLMEGAHEDTDYLLVGRARFQAPEVDGTVIVNDFSELGIGDSALSDSANGAAHNTSPDSGASDRPDQGDLIQGSPAVGSFVNVRITEVAGYDLVGSAVG